MPNYTLRALLVTVIVPLVHAGSNDIPVKEIHSILFVSEFKSS